ncbi:acyltransferase [Cellulomonas sp. KH9]|uniref:acyltransferase family protein n=1 Tax=Cellulomonas sp. KH9 TaxID=1855324 RepID=UPI0008E6BB82|nr:acyltransferase [Cellulomonas sp. KH9]SFK07271.1 Peptidoglycan/LPS O-acetylase OafA/YrhL, contains acyltransferase and SGNH-hydrolase domains [Cellulomonas sp. KH9]
MPRSDVDDTPTPALTPRRGDTGATRPGTPAAPARTATSAGRFDFLDALRGIAAMAVVVQHAAEFIWPDYLRFSIDTFRLGEFGVVLFFLVSGFIIPASLEKYGSVGTFWVGRFFRLFPLYWFCLVVALALAALGRYHLSEEYLSAPWLWSAVNATMVQQFIAGPLAIGASWSLAYEMVFYLAMSILLLVGLNKRSVPIAVTLLGAAGVVGAWVPGRLLTGDHGWPGVLTVISATAAVAVFVAFRAGSARAAVVGVGLAVVAVPLALNQPERVWFSLLLFGTMAVGTVMYRMMTASLRPVIGWSVLVGAVLVIAVVHRVYVSPHVEPLAGAFVTWKPEAVTFGAAYALFGLGYALRARRWPRFVPYLGRISYSLYLVHTLVLYATPWWSEELAARIGLTPQWPTFVTWVLLTVAVSALTYRFVEAPFHSLGRRLTRRPPIVAADAAPAVLAEPAPTMSPAPTEPTVEAVVRGTHPAAVDARTGLPERDSRPEPREQPGRGTPPESQE